MPHGFNIRVPATNRQRVRLLNLCALSLEKPLNPRGGPLLGPKKRIGALYFLSDILNK